jgi:hypothetical protein
MVKGETKKLKIIPRTLDDLLMRDGTSALSLLTGSEPYYLVGGVAVQTYLPSVCRRPTSDIDCSFFGALNYEDFKKLVKPLCEFLQDNHYSTETRKYSRAYGIEFVNSEDESLIIEFGRRNAKSFEKARTRLERELEKSKLKIIEGTNSTCCVAAPEDLVAPKIVRSINSLKRNPFFSKYLTKEIMKLSEEEIRKQLEIISKLRNEAIYNPGGPEIAEELRFISDLYDSRILSELSGFNPEDFEKACADWNTYREESKERDLIVRSVLPKIISNSAA